MREDRVARANPAGKEPPTPQPKIPKEAKTSLQVWTENLHLDDKWVPLELFEETAKLVAVTVHDANEKIEKLEAENQKLTTNLKLSEKMERLQKQKNLKMYERFLTLKDELKQAKQEAKKWVEVVGRLCEALEGEKKAEVKP